MCVPVIVTSGVGKPEDNKENHPLPMRQGLLLELICWPRVIGQ